jgi:hypothetical protein
MGPLVTYVRGTLVAQDQNFGIPGMDRRSLLKKGAVAGALAWTVPTVLATEANALEPPCTPKCAPDTSVLVLDPNTALACQGPGGKWAALSYSLTDAVCPCGGSATVEDLGSEVTPNPSEIKAVSFDPATRTGTILIGGQGTGALGNGTYSAVIFLCVSCEDQTGDTISVLVRLSITFTFQPADGPCSTEENVGDASLDETLTGEPVCGACPPLGA